MKSTKEILAELGFDPESPITTQEAFLKHLVHAAQQVQPTPMSSATKKASEEIKEKQVSNGQGPEQRSFDFDTGKRVS